MHEQLIILPQRVSNSKFDIYLVNDYNKNFSNIMVSATLWNFKGVKLYTRNFPISIMAL